MSDSTLTLKQYSTLVGAQKQRIAALESQLAAAQKANQQLHDARQVSDAEYEAELAAHVQTIREREEQLAKMREALDAILRALNGENYLSMRNATRDWLRNKVKAALDKPTAEIENQETCGPRHPGDIDWE